MIIMVCGCACESLYMHVCTFVYVCVHLGRSFCLYSCLLLVHAVLYGSIGSHCLELPALCLPSSLPVIPTSILCELGSLSNHTVLC